MNRAKYHQAFLVSVLVFIVDQLTKFLAVKHLTVLKKVSFSTFLNFVLVYNPGVSFGMFQSHLVWVRFILILFTFILMGWLLHALIKSQSLIETISHSLILGGAFGNVVDRFTYGAVVDFLDFHLFQYHWPAFNIADSAIVVGVFCILSHQMIKQLKYKKD